jgi:hypothetical protein
MDPHHPESEVPPPSPSKVCYCTRCGGRVEDGLGLESLCVSCDSAWRDEETADTEPAPPPRGSERPSAPSLVDVYDAIMGIAEDVREIRKQLNRLSALHVSRHPEDSHLFRE